MSDGSARTATRVFFATGNGLSPPIGPGTSPPGFLGNSVVRVGLDGTGHLAARDFFALHDVVSLDQNDADLGSGGPVALPDPGANFVGVATGTLGGPDELRYLASSTNVGPLTTGTHAIDVNVYNGRMRSLWTVT
jgi:hypothetical protein